MELLFYDMDESGGFKVFWAADHDGEIRFSPSPLDLEIQFSLSLVAGIQVRPSDILNVEYLPSTLLLEEAAIEKEMADDNTTTGPSTTEGDLRDAFLTMQYHRSKMNEYMCRVYVADEILSELGEDQTSRRGTPAASNHRTSSSRNPLLEDQGSSSYKDWLSRSTLLDDVYRHYDSVMAGSEEIEAGEVTGYAVPQGGGKTTGSGFSSGSYGPPSHTFSQPPPPTAGDEPYYYSPPHDEGPSGKSLALKDLFDLALTALAFLAFGSFVMNLIMTCMIGTQNPPVMVVQTMTTTAAEGAKTRRRRRSLEEELNEMAYRVSRSAETLLSKGRRGESCLRYRLCNDNRRSRGLSRHNRLWLPLWSFGLSWVSGHVGGDRLANLRGAVLGLGAANCEEAYPKCRPS